MPLDVIKIKNIFLAALEIPGVEDRQAYVDAECGADLELQNYVRGMLDAHERHLTPVPMGSTKDDLSEQPIPTPLLTPGTLIDDRYKIIELIAEGGMGAVYRASRINDIKMEVAIKVIKPGMGSDHVLARFNVERQALAIMKHENIARVLDAGRIANGLPYFVMELVKGLSITKFCDESKLSIRERLELFEQVCSAIQHAHQKGIVHRDLKPSNILVGLYDDKPVPKVIDFGLAKALHQPLTEDTLHTNLHAFVGTWQYTAPEQAQLNNLDIDTRADIYSLGVILYELLTGNTPVDRERITNAAYNEVLRMIRDEEPQKPSTKIHSSAKLPSIAALRRSEPGQLERMLRGELDWIVMRALEKDRNRRFPSANDMGEDVRRYLCGEPIRSGPVGWTYRLRKTIRKHQGLVIAASLLLATIVAGSIISSIGWYTAEKERRRANTQSEITVAVNDFLKELLSEADPAVQIKPDQVFISNITVKKVLDRAAEKVGTRFAGKPLTEAAVRHTIGKTYMGLGDLPSARIQFEKAEKLWNSHAGEGDLQSLETVYEHGWLDLQDSKYPQAAEKLKQVVEQREKLLGLTNPSTLKAKYAVGLLLDSQGKKNEAVKMLEYVWEEQKKILGAEHDDTILTQLEIASSLANEGKLPDGLRVYQEVWELRKRSKGKDHPLTLGSYNNLAQLLEIQKDSDKKVFQKTESMYLEMLETCKRTLGVEHPLYFSISCNLATNYIRQNRLNDAIIAYQGIIPVMRRIIGSTADDTIAAMQNCGEVLLYTKQYKTAEPLLLEALSNCIRTFGPEHEKTQTVVEKVIRLYKSMQLPEKVKEYERKVYSKTSLSKN